MFSLAKIVLFDKTETKKHLFFDKTETNNHIVFDKTETNNHPIFDKTETKKGSSRKKMWEPPVTKMKKMILI